MVDRQVTAAFAQPQHGVVHVEGVEPGLERAKLRPQAAQPEREEGEGQRVRHGELDHVLPCHQVAAHQVAGGLQHLDDLQRLAVEGLAGRRQPRRAGRAVDQAHAGPQFERLDAVEQTAGDSNSSSSARRISRRVTRSARRADRLASDSRLSSGSRRRSGGGKLARRCSAHSKRVGRLLENFDPPDLAGVGHTAQEPQAKWRPAAVSGPLSDSGG
jgi:hypothetical protein